MVKLVYHTSVTGPISLDYNRPTITVGSAPGNDLVLPHPSVRPRHCQIEFREDRVVVGAPPGAAADQAEPSREYGIGERLLIGAVVFTVEHSANTVAIPRERPPEEPPVVATGPQYFCPNCRKYYSLSELTRIGLERRRKHLLCPKCSREVIPPAQPAARRGFVFWAKRGAKGLKRWFLGRR